MSAPCFPTNERVRKIVPKNTNQCGFHLSLPLFLRQALGRIPPLLVTFSMGISLLSSAAAQDFTPAAQNDPQRAAATLLSGLCSLAGMPGVQGELGNRACSLEAAPRAQMPAPLQAAAWEEVATQGTFSVEVSNQQFISLGTRLRALRLGATGFDLGGLAFNVNDNLLPSSRLLASAGGGIVSSAPAPRRLGAFISGTFGFGDKDPTSNEDGFDLKTVGVTGGLDYRFTDNFILGFALGHASMDADLDGNTDEVEADSYTASLYSTYYLGNLFFDFTGSAGISDYKMRRNVSYVTSTDSVDKMATSDTDGIQYTLGIGAGYEFHAAGVVFGPYVQLNYLRAEIDSFREGGADEFNLEIGDQKVTSLLSVLGGQISYPMRHSFGTLSPQLRVEWRHEFDNDNRSLSARLINDPSGRVAVFNSDDPDRDYFNVSAGVVATLTGGTSVSLEYETVLGLRDISYHQVRSRLRVSF
jgi:outer membrane lipase/esterase